MKRIGKFLALLAVSASTIVAIPAAPAFAGGDGVGYSQRYQDIRDWRRDGNRYYGGRHYYGRHGHHNRRYYRHHNNNGNAITQHEPTTRLHPNASTKNMEVR